MNKYQNNCYFRVEGQLRHHWGADQEIMAITNRRDKSPETSEVVTRGIEGIELAKPGAMRFRRQITTKNNTRSNKQRRHPPRKRIIQGRRINYFKQV